MASLCVPDVMLGWCGIRRGSADYRASQTGSHRRSSPAGVATPSWWGPAAVGETPMRYGPPPWCRSPAENAAGVPLVTGDLRDSAAPGGPVRRNRVLDLLITRLLQRLRDVCQGLMHLLGPPLRPASPLLAVRRQHLRDALLGSLNDRAQRKANGFESQASTPGRARWGNQQHLKTFCQ